jgi:oligopeptide/dipeptide ABC transporter ATP-binding protein
MSTPAETVLEVTHLRVGFRTESGLVQAVDDVSFTLRRGEVLSIVGESGSGKSVSAMTLMGLTRSPNAIISGSAKLADGTELLAASDELMQHVRGGRIAMIFQDPMSALTAVYRVGDQIAEQILAHERVSRRAARARAVELLGRVGIPRPQERARAFPHEFSGGMRQRVIIAMALSCSPKLLIADEPTTALDVTIQAQILADLANLCRESSVALILITHDFGVVAELADRIAVMYGGRIVEEATVEDLFEDPQHPYTWGLLGCVPRVDRPRARRIPTIAGSAPSLAHPPIGCHLASRCPHAFDRCSDVPSLVARIRGRPDHRDRCWLDVGVKRERRIVDGAIGLASSSAVRV